MLKSTMISLAVVLIGLIPHEIAHGIEMLNHNIPVGKVSIGLGGYFIPAYTFRLESFPGTTFQITPLLVAAFVRPTQEGIQLEEKLGYREEARISGAGVRANLLVGSLVLLGAMLIPFPPTPKRIRFAVLFSGIALTLILFPNVSSMVLFPLVGFSQAIYFLVNPRVLSGPIETFVDIRKNTRTWGDAMLMVGVVSLGFGIFNMIPLLPLDGGRIVRKALSAFDPTLASAYSFSSSLLFLAFVGMILVRDLRRRK